MGTTRVPLENMDDAYKCVAKIIKKARYQNNGKNKTSSRGFLIFSIRVTLNEGGKQPTFIIADLAGKEDMKDTKKNAKAANEAKTGSIKDAVLKKIIKEGVVINQQLEELKRMLINLKRTLKPGKSDPTWKDCNEKGLVAQFYPFIRIDDKEKTLSSDIRVLFTMSPLKVDNDGTKDTMTRGEEWSGMKINLKTTTATGTLDASTQTPKFCKRCGELLKEIESKDKEIVKLTDQLAAKGSNTESEKRIKVLEKELKDREEYQE